MNDTMFEELLRALSEGLVRPQHFWTAVVIGAAVLGGWLAARAARARIDAGLQRRVAAGTTAVDALRFSVEGFKRLAFPIATQLLLWLGALALRAAGVFRADADFRLLRLAMLLFGAMALIRLLVYIVRRAVPRLALTGPLEGTIAIGIWAVVVLYATGFLGDVVDWLESTEVHVGKARASLWVLATGAVSLLAAVLGALWIGSTVETRLAEAQTLDRNVRVVVGRAVKALLLVIAVLLGMSVAGIDLTVLSVFGGALGVGLGLGLQRIASNYVSGFIILLDRSLRIGDLITVDKYYGVVTQINTRYTVVRSLDGTEAIIPNETLVTSPVTNHSYSDRRVRVALKVAVSYEADLERALALMVEAAAVQPRVLKDPAPAALLLGFGADGLELEVGFWIRDPEEGRMNLQSDVAQAILARFRHAGITIPFPQREVRVTGWTPPAAAADRP